jgi:hypothetical protein
MVGYGLAWYNMPEKQGTIYEEECEDCGATFKALTPKAAKSQLSSHKQSHEEEDPLDIA